MRNSSFIAVLPVLAGCASLQTYAPYVKDAPVDTDVGGAGSDDGADTDVGGGPGGGSDTGWGVDTDGADTDVGGGPGGGGSLDVTLGFWQDFDFFYDYQSKGFHEVLIGPEASTDPKDGRWVVAVDDAALQASSTGNGWEVERFDIGAVVKSTGWSRFRVAFHYAALNADNWFVDDVCLSSKANPTTVPDCDLGYEGFEAPSYPQLPTGWSTIRGATHNGSYRWETNFWSHGGYQAVTIHFSANTIDQYLVSGAMNVIP